MTKCRELVVYMVSYKIFSWGRGDTAILEEGGWRGDMPHRSKDHEIIKDIADTFDQFCKK